MSRSLHKLTVLKIKKATGPAKLCDGGGLWLFINAQGAKSWVFRYNLKGREREMGLGPLHTVSLSEARDEAAKYRGIKRKGVDPIEYREREKAQSITFKACAADYLAAHRPGWKNKKHAAQWEKSLVDYAYPLLGDRQISTIDTTDVMKVLKPIWNTKTETATRVRQRIESVLDLAAVNGYRGAENPARWKGHLDKLLPKRSKVQRVKHHDAVPYTQMNEFYKKLMTKTGLGVAPLLFAVLTVVRTKAVIEAEWDEIDLDAGVWVIPADKMKAQREHRVPLPKLAIDLLAGLNRVGNYVFPGAKSGSHVSNMTMLKLLKEGLGYKDKTVHGFRSTFRDWAAELTNFPSEVVKMGMAHAINNQTEAAYRRGDLFAKRAKLMEAWATYIQSANKGEIVSLEKHASSL